MKKVLIILGTRPEAIKLAPVIHALRADGRAFRTSVCLTGQHVEMLQQTVEYLEIEADYRLELARGGQSLFELTALLTSRLESVLDECRPDAVLVQGDTTTAFVGALAAYYRQTWVGHVEAGLRTGNKFAPFPEEMNRRLVGAIADHHYAPTERARQALQSEGIDGSRILVTGNTVIDALLFILEKAKRTPPALPLSDEELSGRRRLVVITGHRRESFGEGFRNICAAVRDLAVRFPETTFVYPVHLNPNVRQPVYSYLGGVDNVRLVDPMGYVPFVWLMSKAHLILTDSGGIQEEAPSLGVPVLVMRKETERLEAVEAGTAILVGTEKSVIVSETSRLLQDEASWESLRTSTNPFGDGKASVRIRRHLERESF